MIIFKIKTDGNHENTANDAIISMLASMNAERRDLFYKSADDYANTLAKGGSFYYKIKRLVSEKPMKFVHLDDLPNDIKNSFSNQTKQMKMFS